jgi:isopenicillin-N epimerase
MPTNPYKQLFLLDKQITFLNFGSFGACVRPVFQRYQQFQLELEEEPVQFMTVKGYQYLHEARTALSTYINCHEDDVVFVTNPSYGVNIISKSLNLKEGDEVLTTNLEYGACDKAWEYYCRKAGTVYKKQPLTLPISSNEELIEELFAGVSPRTKLLFISHITSATALRLPVEEIVKRAKQLGIMTFVDGAHAPGQIALDIKALDADIYTGACHKWMMTPKGSSFLYVARKLQPLFDPLIISWGYDAHQLQGTRDFSAFLTIPSAISFMKENQWDEVAAKCRHLNEINIRPFSKILGTVPLAPVNDDFYAQMCSTPIKTTNAPLLQRTLFEQYGIEVPVMTLGKQSFIRYSIQAFNDQEDLTRLERALLDIKQKTALIE